MSISINPPNIIFINADIPQAALTILQKQLYIDNTISAVSFDTNVAADPTYVGRIHGEQRLLVLRSYEDLTNRLLADLALYYRFGLVIVELNKYGRTAKTLPLERVYTNALTY